MPVWTTVIPPVPNVVVVRPDGVSLTAAKPWYPSAAVALPATMMLPPGAGPARSAD
ncbi:MAG: hypothetical protein U0797_04380 [Gemmataceae bacterium]